MDSRAFTPWVQSILAAILIGGLVALTYLVLAPFLASIAWAVILAYITWPLYRQVRSWMGGRHTLCALLMVACLGITLVLPLLWLVLMVQDNLIAGYRVAAAYLSQGARPLPDFITRIPWLGEQIQGWLSTHLADPSALNQQLAQWSRQGASRLFGMFGGIGRNAAKLAFTLVALFVLYRDGETILGHVRLVLRSLLGARSDAYLNAAGEMSRAVAQSVILTALVQGTIAAFGYWVVGVEVPVLLGALTAVASAIPVFGTFLVWGAISVWLLMSGHPWQALGLFAWGTLLIHPADNLIRPLVISNAMRIPFLLVMFGVFGGIAAFGLLGLFLGPVILAVAITAWNEWVKSVSAISDSAGME